MVVQKVSLISLFFGRNYGFYDVDVYIKCMYQKHIRWFDVCKHPFIWRREEDDVSKKGHGPRHHVLCWFLGFCISRCTCGERLGSWTPASFARAMLRAINRWRRSGAILFSRLLSSSPGVAEREHLSGTSATSVNLTVYLDWRSFVLREHICIARLWIVLRLRQMCCGW